MVIKSFYQFLDHPSDLKIRSVGESLEAMFINAACAMMQFLYGDLETTDSSVVETEEIVVESKDREALFVDWLAEILCLSDTHHRACIHYDIQQLTDQKIVVNVQSIPAQAIRDIKAVTFSELSIIKVNDRWEATFVCDL